MSALYAIFWALWMTVIALTVVTYSADLSHKYEPSWADVAKPFLALAVFAISVLMNPWNGPWKLC